MMPPAPGPAPARLQRPVRVAVVLWVLVSAVVWNGLYDVRISLGVRDHLLHAALHELGRGPELPMAEMMQHTVREAVKLATLWTALVLAAGLGTVLLLSRARSSDATVALPASVDKSAAQPTPRSP